MVWHVQTDSGVRRIPLEDSSNLRLGLLEREEWRKSSPSATSGIAVDKRKARCSSRV